MDRELPQATNEFHQISQQLYETETQDISGNKVNDGFYNGDPNTSLNLLAYRDQVLPSTLYPPPDQDNISPGSNYFPEDQVQTGLFKETLPFMGFGSVDDLLKHDSDQHIAGNTGVLYGTNASQHGYSVPIRSQANEATAISLTATVAEKSIEICINYDTCFGVVSNTCPKRRNPSHKSKIIAISTSSFGGDVGVRSMPVRLQPLGSTFLLSDEDSSTYLGSLNNSKLASALSRLPLRLDTPLFISEIKDTGEKQMKGQMRKHNTK